MGPLGMIGERLTDNADRRDEQANIALAREITAGEDFDAVAEVAGCLSDRKLQSDCIKILDEIAQHRPALVAIHAELLLELLHSKKNRLVWGAMSAIDGIASLRSDLVYTNLDRLREVADRGSVITRDNYVGVLIKLAPGREAEILPLLLDQLASSPVNQFPMYAERSASLFVQERRDEFVAILNRRQTEMNTAAKKSRIGKILRKLG